MYFLVLMNHLFQKFKMIQINFNQMKKILTDKLKLQYHD